MDVSESVTAKMQLLRDAISKHTEVLRTLAHQQNPEERELKRLEEKLASLENIQSGCKPALKIDPPSASKIDPVLYQNSIDELTPPLGNNS